jgi:hypothetical protein
MKQLAQVLTMALLSFSPAQVRAGDWVIVPGKRIGQVSIGMEHAEVLRLLGAPHREDDLEYLSTDEQKKQFAGTLRDDWITPIPISTYPELMATFVTVYVRNRSVVQVEVSARRFKTKGGLSSGSTGLEWRQQYPQFTGTLLHFAHSSAGGWPHAKRVISFEDAVGAGVAWRYASMANLAPETDPKETVEAVAVHAPGKPMIMDPDGGCRFIWKDAPRRLSTEH